LHFAIAIEIIESTKKYLIHVHMKKQIGNNPWKCLNTRKIYENPWILVEEDQVLRPNGSEGIYGRVHMYNQAIGIIPLAENMDTWLVGQYRYPLNEYSWEIPTGGGPMHEDKLYSAKRELREETGLIANKWRQLLRIHTSNSITDEEGFIFLAEDLKLGETDFDDTEDLQIWRLPLKDALDMAMDGRITDSMSLVAILKLSKILKL